MSSGEVPAKTLADSARRIMVSRRLLAETASMVPKRQPTASGTSSEPVATAPFDPADPRPDDGSD